MLAGGGVEADDGDFHGRTALHLAASNGHLATVRRLVLGEGPARSGVQGQTSQFRPAPWAGSASSKVYLSESLLSPGCA